MLKNILNAFRRNADSGGMVPCDWPGDPLSHPSIRAMCERELADLPLSAGYRRPMGEQGTCPSSQ
jgi:hypothetical protein